MLEGSVQILDALRVHLKLHSDRKVAEALGVHHASVGHWRTGRSAMSAETAMKAAELLGVDPGPLVLACLAETERADRVADVLRKLARRLEAAAKKSGRRAAILALALVGAAAITAPGPARAAAGGSAALPPVYIRLNRRRYPKVGAAATAH